MRPINLGAKNQLSLEDGKKYLPYFGSDGFWHITTRGDTGPLGKAFADESCTDIRSELSYDDDNMIIEDFDSSITADEVFSKISEKFSTTSESPTVTSDSAEVDE